jgi:hypothetical protein
VENAQHGSPNQAGPAILRHVRRGSDYGRLTRHPAAEIEERRSQQVTIPFPDGESYEEVAARVSALLDEAAPAYGDSTLLVIGHRATFYALEHLLKGVPMRDVVTAPWVWQSGWRCVTVHKPECAGAGQRGRSELGPWATIEAHHGETMFERARRRRDGRAVEGGGLENCCTRKGTGCERDLAHQ